MTVVFDFDKTLTYKDSLSELFREKSGLLTRFVHLGLKVLSKVGLISVKQEKLAMIRLLFGGDERRFADACREQAGRIRLNPMMDTLREYAARGERVIVLSASAVYLLSEVFSGLEIDIMGSEFEVRDGKILGFRQHPFDQEKLETLRRHGVTHVDEEYFDSHHDECLKDISDRWYRVQDGMIVEHN